eukprot:scaffold121776_cov17-Tisochrysis_lutea.AAC.2
MADNVSVPIGKAFKTFFQAHTSFLMPKLLPFVRFRIMGSSNWCMRRSMICRGSWKSPEQLTHVKEYKSCGLQQLGFTMEFILAAGDLDEVHMPAKPVRCPLCVLASHRLQQLVYEKEFRLRVIMKMHGLPDSAYWLVSYVWNFL